MLAEFFFTPDALSDDCGRNGTEVVRQIEQNLFPSRSVPIAVLCKLGGEQWENAVSKQITRIRDHNHRTDAMRLFKRALELCFGRPIVATPANDEDAWIRAGLASVTQVPLDKIIASSRSTSTENNVTPLTGFLNEDFWSPYENPRLVGRDIDSQKAALRTVCTHADWMMLRMPQIRGGSDDEIVTVKQAIKLSNHLPAGFRKTDIDLHVCMHSNIPENRLVRAISSEVANFIRQGVQIRLTIWPQGHLVNRELLAGDYAKSSSGNLTPRPLWYITMTHVCVGSRDAAIAGTGGNTWSLFSRQKAYERYEQLTAEKPLYSEPLT